MEELSLLNITRFILIPILFILLFSKVIKLEKSLKYFNFVNQNFVIIIYILILCFLKFSKLSYGNYEFFDAGLILNEINKTSNFTFIEIINHYLHHGHFRPINIFLIYIFKLFKSFHLVLLIQTLIITITTIPLYLICKKINFGDKMTFFIITFFLFNPITGFVDILGFHIDTLVLPILAYAFYFHLIKDENKTVIFLILLCLVSEVYILTAAFASLVLFKKKTKKILLFSVFIVLFIIVFYFLLANNSINSPSSVFGDNTAYILLKEISISNLLITFFEIKKIFFFYFFILLFGIFFIQKISFLIIGIPSIIKILISTEPYHYDLTGHYSNDLFIICMMSMIFTLVELKKKNVKIYKLNKNLIIAGFSSLIVANSIYPFSINFWSKTSAGTYNYKNYLNIGSTSNDELKKYLSLNSKEINQSKICINNGPFILEVYRKNINFINFSKKQDCDLIILNIEKNTFVSGSHSSQKEFNEKYHIFKKDIIYSSYNLIIKNKRYLVYEKKENTNQ
jgi:uncharacterized membrane protein